MLKQIAVKPIVTASAGMTIAEAARIMEAEERGCAHRCQCRTTARHAHGPGIVVDVIAIPQDPDAVCVGDVMRKKPATLRDDLGLMDAARGFAKTGVRRLPVVDKAGRVTGILSLDDLMMLLGNEMGFVAGALAAGLRKASYFPVRNTRD